MKLFREFSKNPPKIPLKPIERLAYFKEGYLMKSCKEGLKFRDDWRGLNNRLSGGNIKVSHWKIRPSCWLGGVGAITPASLLLFAQHYYRVIIPHLATKVKSFERDFEENEGKIAYKLGAYPYKVGDLC